MIRYGIICLLLLNVGVMAYDGDEEVVASCSLALSVQAEAAGAGDAAGRALVTAVLYDNQHNPLGGRKLDLSATWGTFICPASPEGKNDDRECFTTDSTGKAHIYLENIPLNTRVQVKAQFDCGDYVVSAFGNVVISLKRTKTK